MGDGSSELSKHRDARRMRKVRLHPSKLLLSAHALGKINHAHQTDRQSFDHARSRNRIKYINDTAISRHQFGRLLEGLITSPPGFECAPQSIRAFPPHPVSGIAYDLFSIPYAEQLDCVVVYLFDDDAVENSRQKSWVDINVCREVFYSACAQLLEDCG